MPTAKAHVLDSSTSKSAAEGMVGMMKKPRPGADYQWVAQLGSTFSQAGLEVMTFDRNALADECRAFWNQNYLMASENHSAKMEGERSLEQTQTAKKFLETLKEEFIQGVSIAPDYVCVVGRKPV